MLAFLWSRNYITSYWFSTPALFTSIWVLAGSVPEDCDEVLWPVNHEDSFLLSCFTIIKTACSVIYSKSENPARNRGAGNIHRLSKPRMGYSGYINKTLTSLFPLPYFYFPPSPYSHSHPSPSLRYLPACTAFCPSFQILENPLLKRRRMTISCLWWEVIQDLDWSRKSTRDSFPFLITFRPNSLSCFR